MIVLTDGRSGAIAHNKESIMIRYECQLCGYVYDPAEGDLTNEIDSGTAFEELPEDWTCPECGGEKQDFEQLP
jgi:rubredoxin